MTYFSVGDRVVRQAEIGGPFVRHGEVMHVDESRLPNICITLRVYTLRWNDTQTTERGYIGVGLQHEPLQIPSVIT